MMTNPVSVNDMILQVVAIVMLSITTPILANDNTLEPRILVSAQGSGNVAPDMAVLSLSVTREATTARAALDANSSAMNDVLKAMKSEGIEERDLQTSGFSIQPRYTRPVPSKSGEREPPRISGYTVRNSLTVRIRDIDNLGAILDKSVSLGVNEGGNITFTNADPSEVIEQARVKAVKKALAKVQTLAAASGVEVGRILEISEHSTSPRPMPMARAERSMAMAADSVPVASGENTYNVTVNISVAILQ